MMAFDFYHAAEKDVGFLDSQNDPHSLFEEYLNADSLQHVVGSSESDRLADFNFDLDRDAASSESLSADSNTATQRLPERPPPSPSKIKPPSPERSSSLRPHRTLPRGPGYDPSSGHNTGAFRGAQVPNKPSQSPPKSFGFPTLRRKAGKLFAVGEPGREKQKSMQRGSKAEEMMGPYCYVQESSPYNDWTQQFQQISLQQHEAYTSALPSPSYEDKADPCAVYSPYDLSVPSHQRSFNEHLAQRHHLQTANGANGNGFELPTDLYEAYSNQVPVQAGAAADDLSANLSHMRSNRPRHSRQPASWSPMPTHHYEPPYSASPSHLHHDLDQLLQEGNEDSFYVNSGLHTTSLPSYSPTEFKINYPSQTSFGRPATTMPRGGVYPLDTTLHDPSLAPQSSPQDPDNITSYTSSPSHATKSGRPCTPPIRARSSSPPAPILDPAPSGRSLKQKRRSGKVGTLRLPKSAGNLKSTKSLRDLRSPRSVGTLKSSKSAAGLKSLGDFGFVNFTPEDKGKILTGVAPSGSSKTKARREQEAFEKKRRLSEAAERAILDAGGDPEALHRLEGLI